MLRNVLVPFILMLVCGLGDSAIAQRSTTIDGVTILPTVVVDGDTIPNAVLREVVVFPKRKFKNNRDLRNYYKMIRNLKITYPYAQIAKRKLIEMDEHFKTLKTKRERDRYIEQVEKEMFREFEGQLRKLTISQGKMLIKLIDRETGRTSYQVVKELKGSFSAGFWQAVARIFGSNLKSEFDPEGEDKILNELIILYEHGQL